VALSYSALEVCAARWLFHSRLRSGVYIGSVLSAQGGIGHKSCRALSGCRVTHGANRRNCPSVAGGAGRLRVRLGPGILKAVTANPRALCVRVMKRAMFKREQK
jgi:hypothetical protein